MKKFDWKFALKMAGVIGCIILFCVLAIIIYLNRLEPLPLDSAMRDFSYHIRGEKYGFGYWFFRIITEFGNFYVIAVIVLIVVFLTKCDMRAILFALGILFAVLLNVALKEIYMRERPFADMRWMNEDSTSFPSGHSTAVGFVYPFLIYLAYHTKLKKSYRYAIYISCSLMMPIVMFSRLILGVHYLTDVLAGVCVGIMVACLAMQIYKICVKYDFMTEGLFVKIRNARKKKEDSE